MELSKRIRLILKESIKDKELISSDTYAIISNAIAEYGHMMDGEKYTLGELANRIAQNLSKTEQVANIVRVLMMYGDKYIEDIVENNQAPTLGYYDRFAVMPPEWAPKFAITGQDPPKSATS